MTPKPGLVLRHPRLNHLDLAKLLVERLPEEQKAWYIVTRVTDTAFGGFGKATAENLVREWTRGRVFCAACEIRWRRAVGSDYNDVLLLCEDAALKLEGFQRVRGKWQVVPPGKGAILRAWGSPRNLGVESRLPRRLHYPAECENGRLLSLYYCTPSGEVQFLRLTGVE
jgi:hypothetical protein